MSGLRLREVDAAAVRPLREAVLRPGRPPAAAVWAGDGDPGTVHVAAYEDGAVEPVGVVTLMPAPYPGPGEPAAGEPVPAGAAGAAGVAGRVWVPADPVAAGPAYQLRGMAVAADRRGGGVGAALLAAALESLRRRGVALVWCNARLPAATLYERAGFVRDGVVFDVPEIGIPHVRMRRPLA